METGMETGGTGREASSGLTLLSLFQAGNIGTGGYLRKTS
jgi:hypothetical protein